MNDFNYNDAISYIVENGYTIRALGDLQNAIARKHDKLVAANKEICAGCHAIVKIAQGKHKDKDRLEDIQALADSMLSEIED